LPSISTSQLQSKFRNWLYFTAPSRFGTLAELELAPGAFKSRWIFLASELARCQIQRESVSFDRFIGK
jgi:hypothetical protein